MQLGRTGGAHQAAPESASPCAAFGEQGLAGGANLGGGTWGNRAGTGQRWVGGLQTVQRWVGG